MKKILLVIAFITGVMSSASAQSAYIEDTWIEHNVYYGGYNCMCVHMELSVDDWEGRSVNMAAYIFDAYGNKVAAPYGAPAAYRTADGQLCVGVNVAVKYESAYWEDAKLYLPYAMLRPGEYQCSVQVSTTSGITLDYSSSEYFTVGGY